MIALGMATALAALLGAPHCLGMCGGLAMAASEGSALAYHAGRIGTYGLLGALAGAFGRWIPGPSWVGILVSTALVLGMAGVIAGWVPEPKVLWPGFSRLSRLLRGRSGAVASVGLGVLNGLLPCGLLYGTLAIPVSSGSAWRGALLMGGFGLMTALPLTFANQGVRKLLVRAPASRPLLAALVAMLALGGLWMRTPGDGEEPACHQEMP